MGRTLKCRGMSRRTTMTRVLACIALVAALLAPAGALAQTASKPSAVKFGIDVLRDENFKSLAGKKVGLIASPSRVDEHLAPTSTLFKKADGPTLVAMFGPEHGIYGNEYA